MEKQRQTNYELLRILMMIAIPLYHIMVYLGVIYLPANKFTIPGLMICSGAPPTNFAFMALSSYFLLKRKNKVILGGFFKLLIQVLLIYFLKMFILCKMCGYSSEITFYNDFFIKGSWWFVHVYLIVLLIYPILNKIIYSVDVFKLKMICYILGIWFIINGFTNDVNLINDFLAFVFTYFVIGYLERIDYKKFIGLFTYKSNLYSIILVGYIVTLGLCIYLKVFSNASLEFANFAVQRLVGKYSFIQFLMGISVFLICKSVQIPFNKIINNIAKHIFYVFLLHETVLAVFWYFNIFRTIEGNLPFTNYIEFIICCCVYIISSFLFGIFVGFFYQISLSKVVNKFTSVLCNFKVFKFLENKYIGVTAWKE